MKWLQHQFESNEKHFKAGGRLEKFMPYMKCYIQFTFH